MMKKIILLGLTLITLSSCSSNTKSTTVATSQNETSESVSKTTVSYNFQEIPTLATFKTIKYTEKGEKETKVDESSITLSLDNTEGTFTIAQLSDEGIEFDFGKDSIILNIKGNFFDETAEWNIFEARDNVTMTDLKTPVLLTMVGQSSSDNGNDSIASTKQILKDKNFKETDEFNQYDTVYLTTLTLQ